MEASIRQPAYVGSFYPASPDDLRADIQGYTDLAQKKSRALGIVLPHAGYMYSGHVAGAVCSRIEFPKRFIILCPNHTGIGASLAIMSRGKWRTPLGDVSVDTDLAQSLASQLDAIHEDSSSHQKEHAIEVQLPFLQVLAPDFTFVPISMWTGKYELFSALGAVIACALRNSNIPTLIIASSDMNHYENDEVTRIKDRRAIDRLLQLDPKGLFETVHEHNISMCGYGPAIAMLTATMQLGATRSELIKYATSGDKYGERNHVVGYAGMAVY